MTIRARERFIRVLVIYIGMVEGSVPVVYRMAAGARRTVVVGGRRVATGAITAGVIEGQLSPDAGIMATPAVGNIRRRMRSGVARAAGDAR